MRLFTAILARNEAAPDRYLRRIIDRCAEFSDAVLLLDDRSTDDTAQCATSQGAVVRTRGERSPAAWGREASARAELWDFACERATAWDDWVLICDADMEMCGPVRDLCRSSEVNGWAFVLYDLWSDTEYRTDGFWKGHETPRVWLVAPRRVAPDFVPVWPDRGVHPGHIPSNFPLTPGVAPEDRFHWLHWAYATSRARETKHAQYMSEAHQLAPHERAHAQSILH